MWIAERQSKPMLIAIVSLCVSIWLLQNLREHGLHLLVAGQGQVVRDADVLPVGNDVYNETLGFAKILAISLPERTDKRDALSLSSALTGFKITYEDGVKGETIPNRALPIGWDRKNSKDTNLGSWRGHINVIRRIVDEGIATALIIEDDVDWDVNIKTQLFRFAAAARELQTGGIWLEDEMLNSYGNDSAAAGGLGDAPSSPYGQGCDMLWIGACQASFIRDRPAQYSIPEDQWDERQVLIENDDTVPTKKHRSGNSRFEWDRYPDKTRVVYVLGDQVCSFAYALSQSGARKALEYMALRGQQKAFDNHLADLCRTRANGMRCIGVVPSLFVHHRPRGWAGGDSDIEGGGDGKDAQFRKIGSTEGILYSTRLNVQRLLTGQPPTMQWDD